jgi:hypothetical protein
VNTRSVPELVEAISQDEAEQGRSLTDGEKAAFAAGFTERYEQHHAIPRCLLRLWDRAHEPRELDGGAIQGWLEYEWEALRVGRPGGDRQGGPREADRTLHRPAGAGASPPHTW